MDIRQARAAFDKEGKIYDSALLTFVGVDGYDVYNCSIPFAMNGREYIFGRVETRREWATSWVRLFEKTGKDTYTLVPDSMIYQLEDPYIQFIGDQLTMGGTHVMKESGEVKSFYGYFYRGTELEHMRYFTTGPDKMKDIRLVSLKDGRIGVFSRPRDKKVEETYGSGAVIGFAVIDSLDDLTADVIENAPAIGNLFGRGEWGGCNQCYLLKDGRIGVIGHKCYAEKDADGVKQSVYLNVAFLFDPETHQAQTVRPHSPKEDGLLGRSVLEAETALAAKPPELGAPVAGRVGSRTFAAGHSRTFRPTGIQPVAADGRSPPGSASPKQRSFLCPPGGDRLLPADFFEGTAAAGKTAVSGRKPCPPGWNACTQHHEHRPIRQWHGAGQRSDHQERQGNHSGAGASVCGFAGQRRGRFQGQPGNHDAAGAAGMAAESLSGAGSQSFFAGSRRTGPAGDGQARTGRTAAGVYGRDSPPPDANRPLEETPRGRLLLQLAWRYGFVTVSTSRNGVRIRYVGEAHAAAMTCLGLNFAEYLAFLHQHRQVMIRPTGEGGYWIVCRPVQGNYVEFSLPEGAEWEVSLDNLGYAAAACTLTITSTPP